ncbi:MAG TPA: biotin/lipoate A/B protein ligase family protein [Paludibacter sp.]
MKMIFSSLQDPGFNLAAEEYLFSQRWDEILFLYINNPCVVIGCNQSAVLECDVSFCQDHAISIYRRMSGGGAVFHDTGNLNFCFISNRTQGYSPLGSEFLLPIIHILNDLEIDVSAGKRKDLWLPGDYKISGTASRVSSTRELHHGTLLYDTDLFKLEKSLTAKAGLTHSYKAIASVPSIVKNIKAYLEEKGQVTLSSADFFDLMLKKLLDFFQLDMCCTLSKEDAEQIELLQKNKYDLLEWTFRK